MLLKDWMRDEGLSDDDMAERIGDISTFLVRKLRFRTHGPSIRVASRIEVLTRGQVLSPDMVPVRSRRAAPAPEAVP